MKQYHFENSGSTVQIKEVTKDTLTSYHVYIQSSCAYGYQREITLSKEYDASLYTLHVYKHPGMRVKITLTDKQANKFIERIEYLCVNYPNTLFNEGRAQAKNYGFVHFHEGFLMDSTNFKRVLESL